MLSAVSSAATSRLFASIAILSLAGILVSAIALQRHYAKSESKFCDLGQQFNCDIVNRSQQSEVIGIPVAAAGIAGYAVLFIFSTFLRKNGTTPNRLLGTAIAGLVFALYLTYVEAYVLETWCVLCLVSLLLIALINLLACMLKWKTSTA